MMCCGETDKQLIYSHRDSGTRCNPITYLKRFVREISPIIFTTKVKRRLQRQLRLPGRWRDEPHWYSHCRTCSYPFCVWWWVAHLNRDANRLIACLFLHNTSYYCIMVQDNDMYYYNLWLLGCRTQNSLLHSVSCALLTLFIFLPFNLAEQCSRQARIRCVHTSALTFTTTCGSRLYFYRYWG